VLSPRLEVRDRSGKTFVQNLSLAQAIEKIRALTLGEEEPSGQMNRDLAAVEDSPGLCLRCDVLPMLGIAACVCMAESQKPVPKVQKWLHEVEYHPHFE